MIKYIIFDIGKVLIECANNWVEAADRARDNPNAAYAPLRITNWNKEAWDKLGFVYFDLLQAGFISEQVYLDRLANHLGIPKDMENWRDVARNIHNSIIGDAIPGASELVEELFEYKKQHSSIHLGCLSNTDAIIWGYSEREKKYPFLDRLAFKFLSHKLGVIKPNPTIYARTEWGIAQLTSNIPIDPDEILFFDDDMNNCKAASERGWHAVWVDPHSDVTTVDQMRNILSWRLP